ncbi:ABC transporter permease [Aliiruegeria sabulilitoris]|uniref:ABC transporter permease n=1 Tax=Aliiruegeria sabulilitoris TaxID=1510458 RepID=UPI00082EE786|nr:ABC transporter permease [Aliiruegeria sabulilitoris]NDR58670.1 ABC transporter permease [Pseudoruegeria sp. M32A2M]
MLFYRAAVRKSLARLLAAPWSLAIWIGIPLLVGALLSAVMGGSDGTSPKVHLLIADEDSSVLSRALTDTLASEQFAELLILEPVSTARGVEILDAAEATAMLVIPEGFQSAFLASEPQALRLVVNPLQSILPDMARELARLIAELGTYTQQALAPELAALGELVEEAETAGLDTETAAETIGALAQETAMKLLRAVPVLIEAPVEIEVITPEGARVASFALLLFPGLLMMGMIFAAQGLAEDLWQEREMGVLRRLKATTTNPAAYLAARSTAAAVVLLAVATPLAIIGFVRLGLPFSQLVPSLLWLALAGLLLHALAGCIQVMAPSRKAGALFSTLVFYPLMLVGGSFFPFESMPDFLAVIGRLTPNGMMLEPLKGALIGTGQPIDFLLPALAALAGIAALTALTAWRLAAAFLAR